MRSELEITPAPSRVQSAILRREVQIPDWLYEEVSEEITPAPSRVRSAILRREVQIPDWLYEQVAARLCEAIGGERYFSGVIGLEAGRISCRLTASVIVYRRAAGEVEQISDLVFVWWEFHTCKDGEELLNNFQSLELKKYMIIRRKPPQYLPCDE